MLVSAEDKSAYISCYFCNSHYPKLGTNMFSWNPEAALYVTNIFRNVALFLGNIILANIYQHLFIDIILSCQLLFRGVGRGKACYFIRLTNLSTFLYVHALLHTNLIMIKGLKRSRDVLIFRIYLWIFF